MNELVNEYLNSFMDGMTKTAWSIPEEFHDFIRDPRVWGLIGGGALGGGAGALLDSKNRLRGGSLGLLGGGIGGMYGLPALLNAISGFKERRAAHNEWRGNSEAIDAAMSEGWPTSEEIAQQKPKDWHWYHTGSGRSPHRSFYHPSTGSPKHAPLAPFYDLRSGEGGSKNRWLDSAPMGLPHNEPAISFPKWRKADEEQHMDRIIDATLDR